MTARYDISQVPPQGGYVAKRCPVRAQNDAIVPGEPLPLTPFQERLIRGGNEFEARIFAELLARNPGAVVINGHGTDAETATANAMASRVPIILGGRLPTDLGNRRVGKPDILVAAPGGGYRAVDVKHHMAVAQEPPGRQGLPALLAPLDAPQLESAAIDERCSTKKNQGDALQLAHYQRMLEALHVAAEDGRWAGIVGTEQRVVWYDLDAPVWRTPSVSQKTKLRSSMERYDFEFGFRLDIIAIAEQHKVEPSVDLLVVPVKISECDTCPWWDYCRPQLEVPPGDVSLLPRIGWTLWKAHRNHGVNNCAELAALDPTTARLVAESVDVTALINAADGADDQQAVTSIATSPRTAEACSAEGINTVADIRRLHTKTASYSDIGLGSLPLHIDLARAALGPEPLYRRRGVEGTSVPRADIEIDIDMENVEDGCYMWGTYTSDLSGLGIVESGYRAFVSWQTISAEVEVANSLRFWKWFSQIRGAAHDRGLTFAAYCWNAQAEETYLKRLGQLAGIESEIDAFIQSDEWVDMLRVWDSQIITGHGSGLKVVAALLGIQWEVEDPGGAESMIRYDAAAAGNVDAREWLLTYNRGDVEATLAVREWLNSTNVAAIEAWSPS